MENSELKLLTFSFEVEELEERLENREWGCGTTITTTNTCTGECTTTYSTEGC